MDNQVTFAALMIYFVLLVGIAIRSYLEKKQDVFRHYMIGDRKITVLGTVASLASGYRDGAGIAVWVLLAYYFSFGAMWLYFGLAVGLIILGLLSPRVRVLAQDRDYITIGDLLGDMIGPKTAKICSGVVVASAFLYAAAQLFVAGKIFADILGLSGNLGIILSASIIGLYLVIGGYGTVIKTDILQWGFIMVIVFIPFMMGPQDFSLRQAGASLFAIDPKSALSVFGIGLTFSIANPDVWQRIFSAKSPRLAKLSFFLTVIVYFFICSGLVIFGLSIQKLMGDVEPQAAFFATFTSNLFHPLIVSSISVLAIASMMSTLDTQVFLFSSTCTRNLMSGNIDNHTRAITQSRMITVGLLALLALLAMTIHDLIAFVFEAASLVTVLGPILFYALYRNKLAQPKIDRFLAGGLGVAVLVYCVMFFAGMLAEMEYFCVPAGVSLAACMATHFFLSDSRTRKKGSQMM